MIHSELQTNAQAAPRLDLVRLDVEWQNRDELFAWEQAVIFKHLSTPVTTRARPHGILESALHD